MSPDYVREFFTDHDGLIYRYPTGHWFTIACTEIEATQERPAGLKYSLAFFDADDRCLVRFDNSHAVKVRGKPNPTSFDHWHRFGDHDEVVPYPFTSIERLIEDFWTAVDRHLPPAYRASG